MMKSMTAFLTMNDKHPAEDEDEDEDEEGLS